MKLSFSSIGLLLISVGILGNVINKFLNNDFNFDFIVYFLEKIGYLFMIFVLYKKYILKPKK